MDMSLEQNISIYSIKNIIIVAKEIQWPVSKQKHNRHQFGSLGPRASYFRLHSLLAFIFKPIFFYHIQNSILLSKMLFLKLNSKYKRYKSV